MISGAGKILYVWNALCSDRARLLEPSSCPSSDAAIWGRAGAVVTPGSGNLLVATGNGPWDGKTNWGDAVIELSPKAKMVGNYTPKNTEGLYDDDLDLGSTSPVYLTPNLIAQGGKDKKIRLLSLARMRGTAPHKGGELQIVSTPSGSHLATAPAVWHARRPLAHRRGRASDGGVGAPKRAAQACLDSPLRRHESRTRGRPPLCVRQDGWRAARLPAGERDACRDPCRLAPGIGTARS